KELRLRRRRLSRHWRAPIDVADLDHAMCRLDAHQCLSSGDLAAGLVDDHEEKRVGTGLCLLEPGLEGGTCLRGIVRQPTEARLGIIDAGNFEEAIAMGGRTQRF